MDLYDHGLIHSLRHDEKILFIPRSLFVPLWGAICSETQPKHLLYLEKVEFKREEKRKANCFVVVSSKRWLGGWLVVR